MQEKLARQRLSTSTKITVSDVMNSAGMQHATHREVISISGLVVEYIVAIDVTRVRFPADACI